MSQNQTFIRGQPNNDTFCLTLLPTGTDETVVLKKDRKFPNFRLTNTITEDDSDDKSLVSVQSERPGNHILKSVLL